MENKPKFTLNEKLKGPMGNIVAIGFGLLILVAVLLLIETTLRFKYNDPNVFYYTFNPAIVTHSELFKRSPLPRKIDPAPRVFCLGGSTTNGCNMPINRSYPNLLDAIIKQNHKSGSAYNFGISGVSAITTNFFIKNILPQYNPNAVVIHDGYNDLPIIIKKLGDDNYEYIKPDYYNPFNPYIKNPVLRYLSGFIKFNLRAMRRFTVTFVKETLRKGGDLFLGFDYTRYPKFTGTAKDIMQENLKRAKIMIDAEIDSIDYCLKNNIKAIIILEPYIKPHHFVPPFGTGFRDENVGEILSECHKIQQTLYLVALAKKYNNNPNVKILDMRELFKGKYPELFYDECHLNGQGNFIKAQYVFNTIDQLFKLPPSDRYLAELISKSKAMINYANTLGRSEELQKLNEASANKPSAPNTKSK